MKFHPSSRKYQTMMYALDILFWVSGMTALVSLVWELAR